MFNQTIAIDAIINDLLIISHLIN